MSEILRRYGCRRDTRDPRDQVMRMMAARAPSFPPSVDLRKFVPPIMDQGDLGSCVANATTAALRYHVRRAGAADHPLSRLQVYYYTRVIEKTVKEDAGCEIRNAIKSIKKNGATKEVYWPYVESKFDVEPPKSAVEKGKLWSALTYERVPVSVVGVKQALVQGFPVVVGLTLFSSFESDDVEKTGVVPMPNVDKEDMVGGHAMYVTGYGQRPGCFTIANSWSAKWGDRGYCYVPERYVGSTEFGADYWVVQYLGGH